MTRQRDPATVVAGARTDLDPAHGGIVPPTWTSDTFRWPSAEDKPAFDYARTVSPNRAILIDTLAELEGAAGGVVTNSGQAAALLPLLRLPAGARVVAPNDCYGGTYRLINGLAQQGKLQATFVDLLDDSAFQAALAQGCDLLWIETPSNPLLRITDIARRAQAARAVGALSVADNTLLTPLRQRPLDLGCDMVMHSTTKALNGHSDLFGGALLARDPALIEELAWWSNAAGLNGSATDSAQILRGLRTLPLRVDRQEETAKHLAEWLCQHQQVRTVHYPGLADDAGYELGRIQQSGPGFLISFRVDGDSSAFLGRLEVITLAASLGGFATLICKPSSMTHRGMPADAQAAAGIHSDLLRLSVGLEAATDLLVDLERGFAALR